ncbi:pantetheine-phosphate adenylyltransferase [Apibacter adventoris]|uniref:Phosphopantetheine adenylyltransferase n=1 Tax=Apibacter adventoris TaxID=1679466 RepID=A0A2S8AFR3_9FLAO|nr:pantetheine-phosphate adenylyltransferase [Apibacter adventoris]PQL94006.1 pantetheine-phosphate adenylyltransferase [Apibacter adventoris]PQL94882.1 pantetheine-phosphate adenylyltransferase [Apibacter adventoris]
MEKIAVFPGSFDPITLGHFDIIERAVPLFDKIIVAIGNNSNKEYMFPLEKRMQWIQETVEHFPHIEVDHFEGLTIDYCFEKKAQYIIRGLRNPADFEFEKAIAHTNRTLANKNLETVFFLTSSGKSFISSSIVREIMKYKGHYEILVPKPVRI